jgi:hypothetical protein
MKNLDELSYDLQNIIYENLFYRSNSVLKINYFLELLNFIETNVQKESVKRLLNYIVSLPDCQLENSEIFAD